MVGDRTKIYFPILYATCVTGSLSNILVLLQPALCSSWHGEPDLSYLRLRTTAMADEFADKVPPSFDAAVWCFLEASIISYDLLCNFGYCIHKSEFRFLIFNWMMVPVHWMPYMHGWIFWDFTCIGLCLVEQIEIFASKNNFRDL